MPAELIIPYTDPDLTLAAPKAAGELAAGAVALLDVHVVPTPLSLENPDIDEEYLREKLEQLVAASGVRARIELIFARDRRQALARAVPRGCLVLMATRNHWWPTAGKRLARVLRRHGHNVALLIHPAPRQATMVTSTPC